MKKSHFKEPKCSLSYSQVPIPGPMSRFHILHIYLFIAHFNIILSVTAKCSELFLSFRFAHKNPVRISLLSHSRHIPSPPHHFWLDHSNNIWRAVQIVMLIIHIGPASCTSSRSSWSVILKYLLGCQQFPNKWFCNDDRDSKFDAAERRESYRLHEHVETWVRMSVNAHCFVLMLSRPFISTPRVSVEGT
jgi:hypothetical protein